VRSSILPGEGTIGREEVRLATIDEMASELRADRIDLLKIDTEGYEERVLRGAGALLAGGAIQVVLAEVSPAGPTGDHCGLDAVQDHLSPFGYLLFGLYDQTAEYRGPLTLRYCNAAFLRVPAGPSSAAP
jgi:hypothetical protein